MATLGQRAQARGFVTSPFTAAPTPAPAAPKRTARDPAPASLLSQRLAAAQGQNKAKKEQEQAAGGLLGRGLGMVLNNPVANVVLRPLDVLDVPRRAVWSTVQEIKDAATGEGFSPWDWYNQTNPLHAITQRGDVSFGAGDVIPEFDTPLSAGWDKWLNRGVGLAGDIAGDPLTYVAGLGFVADAPMVARGLEKLSDAQRIAKSAAESEDIFRALGFADELMPTHLPGAGARAAELGGTEALERFGQRGLSGTTPLQRQIMELPEQAVNVKIPFTRMQPRALPGTRKIGAAFAEGKAAVKAGARKLPGAARVREMRAPIGVLGNDLQPAYERILTGRGGGSIQGAINTIAIDNKARRAGGSFGAVAADELNRLESRVKGLTPEQRADMVRMAEEDPNVINAFTDYQQKVIDVAKYLGVNLPEMQGGRYVMPHVLDRGFRNHLLKLSRSNDPRAAHFMDSAGLKTEDLLEEGGFMQRRQWRPNEDGTPFKAKIGDQEIDIEIGSIDELNEKLRTVFPDYTGPIYEIDPIIAWRGYIQATSKDVAKRYAYTQAARQGLEGVEVKPKQPQQYDPYAGRVDLPPRIGPEGEEIPVQRVTAAEPFELTPEQARFYRPSTTTPSAEAATKARNKEILKTQPKLLDEYRTASEARRVEIAGELEEITDNLLGPISEERGRMLALRNQAGQTRDVMAARIEEIQKIELPAIQTQIDEVNTELKQLANARSSVTRTARSRTARRQDELLDRVQTQHAELIRQRDELSALYRERSGEIQGKAEAALEEVRQAAPEKRAAAIRRYEADLTGRRDRAHELLTNRWNEAKRKWKARAEFKRAKANRFGPADGTTVAGYRAANKHLQDNPTVLRDLRNLEDQSYNLRRQNGLLNAEMTTIDEDIAHQRRELNRLTGMKRAERQRRLDYIDERLRQRHTLQQQLDALQPRLEQVNRNLQTGSIKAVREALDYRETYQRFVNEMKMATGSERGRVADLDLEYEQWQRGKQTEEALQAAKAAPPAAAAPITPEVEEAQKYLQTKAAMQYIEDRNRVAALSEQRIKTAKRGGVKESKKFQAELRAERRALEESLERRYQTGRKVSKYEAIIKKANAPAEAAPAGPPRHPLYEQIEAGATQEELAAQRDVVDLNRQQAEVSQELMPQIAQTEQDIISTGAQLERIGGGLDPEYNAIIMEEAQNAIEKRTALSDEAERAKLARGELTAAEARLDEELGTFQTIYTDAVNNEAKYRADHARIATKADATRVNRAKDRAEMLPKGTKLDEAAAGVIPTYEAQPLQRTVDDLNKVIALNPTGDDALVKRAEAALYPIEKKLADLTTELDIPAREVEQIIAAARKGELAPVISYLMKSDWRRVWDNGDVVISKELEAAYKHLTTALQNPGEFSRILTAYTNFFKTYATLTPGFHVRNGLSAIFMNTVDGVLMRNQFDGVRLWREYAKSDSPLEWLMAQDQQVQDAFQAVFGSGAGGRYFEAGFAKSTSGGRKRQTLYSNPATRLSQKVGQNWTEGPVRLGMALDTIRNGQSVGDAIGRITRIHFDYGQISKFDEKAKRLIPFWTFMSRNLPMQITEMWSKPRVYAWLNSVLRNVKGEEPEGGVPDYFGSLGAIPLADTKLMGMPVFLQPDLGHARVATDLHDLEAALSGENLMRPLTNLNPIFTAGPEYITQRDFYTGQTFKDTDVRKLGPMEKLMQPILGPLGLLKEAPNGTPLVEERLPNMLQALNPLYARGARLAPELTTGAEGDMQRQMEAWLRTFLGVPIRTLSPEQQKNARRSEYYQRLDDERVREAMAKAAAA